MSKYEKVFRDLSLGIPPDRGVEHIIELEIGTQPIKMHPDKHPKRIWAKIEEDIKYLLDLGLIRPTSNPYSSLVVMVKKNYRTLRMCIHFTALNKNTMKNRHRIPRIHELMDKLHGSMFFSKIELRSSSHELVIPKTAFKCHYGHFDFFVMHFGLKNTPATFQSCMKNIFHKQLCKFVLVFFDDIRI